jgi:hypothetical protein
MTTEGGGTLPLQSDPAGPGATRESPAAQAEATAVKNLLTWEITPGLLLSVRVLIVLILGRVVVAISRRHAE